VLRVQLPVSIIENPAVNMGATGKRLPTEAALQALLEGAIGRPCGDGTLALGQEVFARADADAGELETVAGFDAALIVRPR
jgi:hypothetical protein